MRVLWLSVLPAILLGALAATAQVVPQAPAPEAAPAAAPPAAPPQPAVTRSRGSRGDVFTVGGLSVEGEADSTVKARDIALARGQSQALRLLLERLTLPEDHERLPRPDFQQVAALVASLSVQRERSSATRYLAEMSVDFRNDAIRRLLRDLDIPYAETQAAPAVLLAVYTQGPTRMLFEPANPWAAAWRELALQPGRLFPIRVPEGSDAEQAIVSPEQAIAGDMVRLQALADRYGTGNVVVADGRLAIDFDRGGTPTFQFNVVRYGAGEPATLIDTVSAQGAETVEDVLRRAASQAADEMESQWKRENVLRFDEEDVLSVQAPFEELGDWVELRRRLRDSPIVRELVIERLSRGDAQLRVNYLGSPEQLRLALGQSGLALEQQGGYWTVRLRERAGR